MKLLLITILPTYPFALYRYQGKLYVAISNAEMRRVFGEPVKPVKTNKGFPPCE